jgi:hypothetical protein
MLPVAPYSSETPIRVTAVEVTETRKNFSAASAAAGSPRRSPVIAKAGSETSSSATTRVTRSREAARVSAPAAEQSSRNPHSPCGVRPPPTEAVFISATTAVQTSTTPHTTSVKRSTSYEHGGGPATTSPTQKVRRGSFHSRVAGTAAATTATTVSVEGTSAAPRDRGGPAKAACSSTSTAATASTSGAAIASQSICWTREPFTAPPGSRRHRPRPG